MRTLLLFMLVIVSGVTAIGALLQPKVEAKPQEQLVSEAIRIPTKDEIVANAQWGIEKPEILDVRLLFSEEATEAAGAGIVYEGEFYKRDAPVWVVAVKSGTVSAQLPDVGQGDSKYAGILWILNAADGQAIMMSSIQDVEGDPRLARLRALPDRDGTIKIDPQPAQPIAPPEPTPTAISRTDK